ncbi:MAG: Asp-tRNA(Asn)/Glu-tRNA(Gln) amidotransferase subunit GatC [bacterium]
MMAKAKLSKEQVGGVAKLAYIAVDEAEEAKYAADLGEVLNYVAELQQIDLKVLPESMVGSQITGVSNVMAEDEIVRCEIPREEFLKRAPSSETGQIKVKSVFGDRS